MQKLAFANNKGGVGKSSTADQFAYYLNKMGKRVAVIELDHQLNSTKSLSLSPHVKVSTTTTTQIFLNGATSFEPGNFVLFPGTRELKDLEKQGAAQHNVFATNMAKFLDRIKDDFDVCIIDTNGNPDIRVTIALVLSDFVLSPIQLNQEAIDGIGDLIGDIKKIKRLNPKLHLIGLLPNMVQASPFQKANFDQIAKNYAHLLIMTAPDSNDFCHIPMRSVIPEAQAAGVPLWEIKKTAARDAWRELEPYFKVIANRIGMEL